MRRRGILLTAAMLLIAPAMVGAATITVTGTGTYDTTNMLFTGDVAALSVLGAPQNDGDYVPTYDSTLGPIQVFADVGFGVLSTGAPALDPLATAPFAGPGGIFAMPYYFLQFGLGTFTVNASGIITGSGTDFKNDPSFDGDVRSPFFTFFGIDAPNEEYSFLFTATPDASVANLYNFTLTNTPVPEPGTMLFLGSGLAGLAGVMRRRRPKP